MRKPDGAAKPMPAWLLARYVAVAAELKQMHGARFAAAFLMDSGIAPSIRIFDASWHQPIVDLETIG
jgi:hypothetical protein